MCLYLKKFTISFGSIVVQFGKLEGTGQEQGFFLDLSRQEGNTGIIAPGRVQ